MWLGGQVNISACSHLNLMERPGSGDRGGHQKFLDHTAGLHSRAPPEHTSSFRLTAHHFPFPHGLHINAEVSCSPLAPLTCCVQRQWGERRKGKKGNQPISKWSRKRSQKSRAPGCTAQCLL